MSQRGVEFNSFFFYLGLDNGVFVLDCNLFYDVLVVLFIICTTLISG